MKTPRSSTIATEKELQESILKAAVQLGWSVYHTFDSRRSAAGFPDLVLTDGRRIAFIEVKRQDGRLTAAQRLWLSQLAAVAHGPGQGWTVGVWVARPSNLLATYQALAPGGAAFPDTQDEWR